MSNVFFQGVFAPDSLPDKLQELILSVSSMSPKDQIDALIVISQQMTLLVQRLNFQFHMSNRIIQSQSEQIRLLQEFVK
jgi:hypothetical protein